MSIPTKVRNFITNAMVFLDTGRILWFTINIHEKPVQKTWKFGTFDKDVQGT